MHFIIPKNYKFKPKILGLIDYQSAVLLSLWGGFLYILVNFLFSSISIKLYFSISLFIPALLFCIIGINNESIIYILKYMLKYYLNQKIYLYKGAIK